MAIASPLSSRSFEAYTKFTFVTAHNFVISGLGAIRYLITPRIHLCTNGQFCIVALSSTRSLMVKSIALTARGIYGTRTSWRTANFSPKGKTAKRYSALPFYGRIYMKKIFLLVITVFLNLFCFESLEYHIEFENKNLNSLCEITYYDTNSEKFFISSYKNNKLT